MRALLAALLAVVVLVAVTDGSAAAGPSLRPIRFAPLVVAGRGFAPGEKVTVTAYAGTMRAVKVVADRAGNFRARFAFTQPRCTAWLVRAVGTRSGRVSYRGPLGYCDPLAAAGSAPPAGGTGVAGIVRRGPIAPVCAAEVRCNAPAAGVAVDLLQGDAVVSHVVTGEDGRYYVLAAPGDYLVRAAGRGLAPHPARVNFGDFTEVDFLIDTGIR